MKRLVLTLSALLLPAISDAASITRVAGPASTDRMRILVAGDLHGAGAGRLAPEVARLWSRGEIDGVILLGDNFDGCGISSPSDAEWRHYSSLIRIGVPIYPILGNHDYGNAKKRFGTIQVCGRPNPQAQIEFSRATPTWRFPRRNYVISTPLAEFVMTDTTPVAVNANRPLLGSDTAEGIRRFAQKALADPAARGRWNIVFGHHNIDQSGVKRWKSAGTRQEMAEFGAILRRGGADLYVSGHQHQMELLGATSEAPVQLISGLGARPKDESRLAPRERHSLFVGTVDDDSVGFAIIEITRRHLRVSFRETTRATPIREFEVTKRNDRVVIADISAQRPIPGASSDPASAGSVRGNGGDSTHRAD